MPKKALENLTESMFYVLLALQTGDLCGIEIAQWMEERTNQRIQIGPATLYTILAKFEKEKYIRETEVLGRKRTYTLTDKGKKAYQAEYIRLLYCLKDAEDTQKEVEHID